MNIIDWSVSILNVEMTVGPYEACSPAPLNYDAPVA